MSDSYGFYFFGINVTNVEENIVDEIFRQKKLTNNHLTEFSVELPHSDTNKFIYVDGTFDTLQQVDELLPTQLKPTNPFQLEKIQKEIKEKDQSYDDDKPRWIIVIKDPYSSEF